MEAPPPPLLPPPPPPPPLVLFPDPTLALLLKMDCDRILSLALSSFPFDLGSSVAKGRGEGVQDRASKPTALFSMAEAIIQRTCCWAHPTHLLLLLGSSERKAIDALMPSSSETGSSCRPEGRPSMSRLHAARRREICEGRSRQLAVGVKSVSSLQSWTLQTFVPAPLCGPCIPLIQPRILCLGLPQPGPQQLVDAIGVKVHRVVVLLQVCDGLGGGPGLRAVRGRGG